MKTVIHDAMTFLVSLFVIGWVGSIIVVVISGAEDLKTILSKDETPHGPIEG